MGIVPSCTRAELPWVAEGVQGQLEGMIRVTSLGKWSTKSCAGVHRGVQRCTEMHRGVWRCTEVCRRVCEGVQRCAEVHGGVRRCVEMHRGVWRCTEVC